MLRHFEIDSTGISQVHLINVKNNRLMIGDQDLDGKQYFLGFSRLGQHLALNSNDQSEYRRLPLLQKRLFHRERSAHHVGRVEVLEPDKTRKCQFEHHCPFLDCAKTFKRSCDLLIHFRVEAGIRPYVCGGCSKQFRRKILLDKHQSRGICATKQSQTPVSREEAKVEWVQDSSNLAGQEECFYRCSHCGRGYSSPQNLQVHWKHCLTVSKFLDSKEASSLVDQSSEAKDGIIQISKNDYILNAYRACIKERQQNPFIQLLICVNILETAKMLGAAGQILGSNYQFS